MQARFVVHHGQRVAEARRDRIDEDLPALALKRPHAPHVRRQIPSCWRAYSRSARMTSSEISLVGIESAQESAQI
jgi:hypothetical protein